MTTFSFFGCTIHFQPQKSHPILTKNRAITPYKRIQNLWRAFSFSRVCNDSIRLRFVLYESLWHSHTVGWRPTAHRCYYKGFHLPPGSDACWKSVGPLETTGVTTGLAWDTAESEVDPSSLRSFGDAERTPIWEGTLTYRTVPCTFWADRQGK